MFKINNNRFKMTNDQQVVFEIGINACLEDEKDRLEKLKNRSLRGEITVERRMYKHVQCFEIEMNWRGKMTYNNDSKNDVRTYRYKVESARCGKIPGNRRKSWKSDRFIIHACDFWRKRMSFWTCNGERCRRNLFVKFIGVCCSYYRARAPSTCTSDLDVVGIWKTWYLQLRITRCKDEGCPRRYYRADISGKDRTEGIRVEGKRE